MFGYALLVTGVKKAVREPKQLPSWAVSKEQRLKERTVSLIEFFPFKLQSTDRITAIGAQLRLTQQRILTTR